MKKEYKAKYSSTRTSTPWTKGPVTSGPYFSFLKFFEKIVATLKNPWFGLLVNVLALVWGWSGWATVAGTFKTFGAAATLGGVLLGLVFGVIGCLMWFMINKLQFSGATAAAYSKIPASVRARRDAYRTFFPVYPFEVLVLILSTYLYDHFFECVDFILSVPKAMFEVPGFYIFFCFLFGFGFVIACWEYHLRRPAFREGIHDVFDEWYWYLGEDLPYFDDLTFGWLLNRGWKLICCWALWTYGHLYSKQLWGLVSFILHGSWDSIYLGIAFGCALGSLLGALYGLFFCWMGTDSKSSAEASDEFCYRIFWRWMPDSWMPYRHLLAALAACLISPIIFSFYPIYFLGTFYVFGVGHNIYAFWLSVFGALYLMRLILRTYWNSPEVGIWLTESFTGVYLIPSLKNCGFVVGAIIVVVCGYLWFKPLLAFITPLLHMSASCFWPGFVLGFIMFVEYVRHLKEDVHGRWWLPQGLPPVPCKTNLHIWPYWHSHRRLWYIVGSLLLFCIAYPLCWVLYTHIHLLPIKIIWARFIAGGVISSLISVYCGFMFGTWCNRLYWLWPFLPIKIRFWLTGRSARPVSWVVKEVFTLPNGRKGRRDAVRTRVEHRRGNGVLRAIVLPHHKPRRTPW